MSTTRKLRYTGERPQAFMEHEIGELQPGDEFTVPAGEAERYMRRADIRDARSSKTAAEDKPETAAAEDGSGS